MQTSLQSNKQTCAVIPTYNNATTIRDVVDGVLRVGLHAIVVSDGSTDETLSILAEMTSAAADVSPGITLVSLARNAGKGHALREGFRKAQELGYKQVVTLDADGQHFPEDIPLLVDASRAHPGAIIVGMRQNLEEAERSWGSKFANAFSNFWFALQTLHPIPDTQSGFRLYPLSRLSGLSLLTSRYEAELELLVFASWSGTEIVSQPVRVYYPPRHERVSHFRPAADFSRIFVLNTLLCALAIVYGWPRKLWRGLKMVCRTAYAILFFLVSTLLVMRPLAWYYRLTVKDLEARRLCFHRLLCRYARFVTLQHGIPGVSVSTRNPSGEDFSRPAIIISNHQSHLDLMTMLLHTPMLVCLTKDWVWHNPLYGSIIREAEFYPVSQGIEVLLPKLRSLIARGYSIVVYPEGTRSASCRILRFHGGAFYLAKELGVDLLPIVSYGTGHALPKDGKWLRESRVCIEIGERLSPEQLAALGETPTAQASTMRHKYMTWYDNLASQTELVD